MEHVVFHPGPDGSPAYRCFASLEDAVRYVEHMRNVEGVEDVSVHQLTPVPLAFRAYYKVEVPSVDVPAQPVVAQPAEADPVMAEPVVDAVEELPVDVVPEPEPALAANGKKTLGFFAG